MRILFLNPQGNFDKKDSLWTMHPDFGGQLVYVKEIASEMAKLGHHVDIVTRKIDDPDFPMFSKEIDGYENIDNLRIIRIPCGGPLFLEKELLWEHLDEWTHNIINYYKNENIKIDFMTGHYGDGGLSCAMIKQKTGIPYSFTGHSLGAQKFDKMNDNFSNFDVLLDKYKFEKRILAERTAMKYSDLIFTSTEQERDNQYTHILYKDIIPSFDRFVVAPPGANVRVFELASNENINEFIKEKINKVISRDIESNRCNLPYVILASRLDPKKNHIGAVIAFAENQDLQKKANLFISLRGIEDAFIDYSNASADDKVILDEIMDLISNYNLKGKVTFASINSQQELADTYRYLTTFKSIFCLTSLYEPFGLAPIEAMSTGLPVAVTMYGGPSGVLKENNEEYGVLLDVKNHKDISLGILKVLENHSFYQKQGIKRVFEKYTWTETAKTYLKSIKEKGVLSQNVIVPNAFLNDSYNEYREFIRNKYKGVVTNE